MFSQLISSSFLKIFIFIFTQCFLIRDNCLLNAVENYHTITYQAIDKTTFQAYSSLWSSQHSSWIAIEDGSVTCPNRFYFPTCIDGNMLGPKKNKCASIVCLSDTSCDPIVPQDTIDYPPPPPTTSLDNATICAPPPPSALPYLTSPGYGLDQGIPPYFQPLDIIPLIIRGKVTSANENTQCNPIAGASIEAWHIDISKLPVASRSNNLDPGSATHPTSSSSSSSSDTPIILRDISCRGSVITDSSGEFEFSTTLPASYGPPRHVNFIVKAEGYETLHTRLYFAEDWRLQQTGPLDNEPTEYRRIKYKNTRLSNTVRGFDNDDDHSHDEGSAVYKRNQDTNVDFIYPDLPLPGALDFDPRVSHLELLANSNSKGKRNDSYIQGTFHSNFSIVLKPIRNLESTFEGSNMFNQSETPVDINGVWTASDGGYVKIETNGDIFQAVEYPHPRSWGTVSGLLSGDTIYGVDFRSSVEFQDDRLDSMDNHPWTASKTASQAKDIERMNGLLSERMWSSKPDSIWSPSISTGVLVNTDEFATASDEMRIVWTGADKEMVWSRPSSSTSSSEGYRYLKLEITRETGGYPGGKMVINEIEFYEGIVSQRVVPRWDLKMKSPRYPSPQIVTCSSYETQFSHCFRVFDGSSSSNSSWVTKAVGSSRNVLSSPQWVLIDLGHKSGIFPTGLKIVCDSEHDSSPKGCPKTFTLYGSHDNVRFETLFMKDLFDYNNDYANGGGGLTMHFYWESGIGRLNGHRCGSCDKSPRFKCNTDGYDSTCASRYCSKDGRCASQIRCPQGQFLEKTFLTNPTTGYGATTGTPSTSCKPCPAGRYGNVSGLTSPSCSGPCEEGYYCTGGASHPRQYECGHSGVFCPEGSPEPIPASAGRKTVSNIDDFKAYHYSTATEVNHPGSFRFQSDLSELVRKADMLCDPGHYCVNGVQVMCPEGTYGNSSGLATSVCSGYCLTGRYCPSGSITPTVCPTGSYCPDGKIKVFCPPGTFGATRGLKDRSCSGLCTPGFYCPEGSVSSVSRYCPAGKYGEQAGLGDPACSGDCDAGFYCPGPPVAPNGQPTDRISNYSPNTKFRMHECGSPKYFCPKGSSDPIKVSQGYYTGGGVETQRTSQRVCEKGFYCVDGVRHPCPLGYFGNKEGLSSLYGPDITPFICDGICDKGYYCPYNSSSSRQYPCPAGTYGSSLGLSTPSCTDICPLGHYCPLGSPVPTPCPAGRYGNTTGLTTKECAADCREIDAVCDSSASLCREGFFCPPGSTSSEQNECGSPGVYCPKGSSLPIPVSGGYYSIGPIIPRAQSTASLVSVSDDFSGYDSFPYSLLEASSTLIAANRRTFQKICETGHFCHKGVKSPCPAGTYGDTQGLTSVSCSDPCPIGHYCPTGSINGTELRCPAGRYGSVVGLQNSACSGLCDPGYYCPEGSVSPRERQCGSYQGLLEAHHFQTRAFGAKSYDIQSLGEIIREETVVISKDPMNCQASVGGSLTYAEQVLESEACSLETAKALHILANSVFCPLGSGVPLFALPGYYTINGNATTRSAQVSCPLGAYCSRGVIKDCPAGRFGRTDRLSASSCSGSCQLGFYCPPGSTSPNEKPCPIGRYGSKNGLGSVGCSGGCLHPYDCELGSTKDVLPVDQINPKVW